MPPNTPEEMRTPPPPLDGELRFDEATRNGRADDFGQARRAQGRARGRCGGVIPNRQAAQSALVAAGHLACRRMTKIHSCRRQRHPGRCRPR